MAHFVGMVRALRWCGRNLGRHETIPNSRLAFVFALSNDSEGRDRVAQEESMQIRSRCMGVIGLSVAVGLLACTSGAMSQPVRDKARFVVNVGTEHQVFNAPLVAGQQVCFEFRSLATGAPARVHLRRTENGKPRDLDFNTGGRCLKMNRVGGCTWSM
jgi:hypothetical protein